MRRGEVRWYKFSKHDKRRPAVILTRSSAIDHLGEVTVAPITRTIREGPSDVLLTRTVCLKTVRSVSTTSRLSAKVNWAVSLQL